MPKLRREILRPEQGPDPLPECGAAFVAVALTARGRAAEAVAARPAPTRKRPSSIPPAGPSWCRSTRSRPRRPKTDIPIDGVEIEDDIPADDTFLEEEEEGDDDVADLIDGDIEDDEEV